MITNTIKLLKIGTFQNYGHSPKIEQFGFTMHK